jgi:hypothetical protein
MGENVEGGGMAGFETLEAEPTKTLAGAAAFASAVAAKLAGSDSAVAHETGKFLNDQAQLLRVQKKHLEGEHDLRIAPEWRSARGIVTGPSSQDEGLQNRLTRAYQKRMGR